MASTPSFGKNKIRAALGVDNGKLARLIELGLPHTKSGRTYYFDRDICEGWYQGYQTGGEEQRQKSQAKTIVAGAEGLDPLTAEKLRKLSLEADMVQHKLDVSRGDYVLREEAIREHENGVKALRSFLLNIPGRYAQQLVDLEGARPEMHTFLLNMVREIMTELSNPSGALNPFTEEELLEVEEEQPKPKAKRKGKKV